MRPTRSDPELRSHALDLKRHQPVLHSARLESQELHLGWNEPFQQTELHEAPMQRAAARLHRDAGATAWPFSESDAGRQWDCWPRNRCLNAASKGGTDLTMRLPGSTNCQSLLWAVLDGS